MVDLKDRINKPRSLRGTPSYAYINKLCGWGVLLTSVIGLTYAVVWWRKEVRRGNFDYVSLDEINRERQAARVQGYVEVRRQMLEETRREKEEAEMYSVGN